MRKNPDCQNAADGSDSVGCAPAKTSRTRGLRLPVTCIAVGIAVLYCSERSIASMFQAGGSEGSSPFALLEAFVSTSVRNWAQSSSSASDVASSRPAAKTAIRSPGQAVENSTNQVVRSASYSLTPPEAIPRSSVSAFPLQAFQAEPARELVASASGGGATNDFHTAAVITWADVARNFNAGSSWTGGTAPGASDIATFSNPVGPLNAATLRWQPNLTASTTISGLNFTSAGWDLTSSGPAVTLSLNSTGTGASGAINSSIGSGTNTIDAPLILNATGGSTQTFTQSGGGTLVLNGIISSTNAITLSLASTGTFWINGTNTYTGTTSQAAGSTIIIGNKAAFGASTLSFASNTNTIRAGIDLTGANKLTNNIIWGANATIQNSGNFGIEFGGTVNLNGAARTINSAISGGAIFDGIISNDAGGGLSIVTSNGSVVTLANAANSYTGFTTISGTGKVSVSTIGNSGSNGNLGAGIAISLGSGASSGFLLYTGTGETTTKSLLLNGSTGGAIVDQSGASGLLKFTNSGLAAGNKTLTLQGSTAGTGEISAGLGQGGVDVISLVKAGTGTWTLSGNNSYSGSTTVNGGTLAMNYSTQNNSKLSDTAALIMGGGTATFSGNTAALTETVGGLTINPGGSAISVTSNNAGGLTLALGAISRTAGNGGTIDFKTTNTSGTAAITTTSANTAGSILAGWATFGLNDWAVSSAGNVTPLSSYFVYDNVSGWIGAGANSTSNMTDSNGYDATYTNSITLNSLRFNSGTSDSNVGVVTGNNITLGSGGLLVTNNVGAKYQRLGFLNTSFNIGEGQGGLTTTGSELFLTNNNSGSGHLEIYSTIFGSGVSLVKSGAGFVDLRGLAASYGGSTTINAGTLQLSGGNDRLPTGTSVTMNGGVLQLASVDQTVAGLSGGPTATIDHAGAGTNTLSLNLAGSATNTFAGVIKNTAGTLKVAKGGSATSTWVLSGNNTYTGETDINAGIVQANANSALGASAAPVFVGNGALGSSGVAATLAVNAGVTLQNTTIVTNPDFGGSNSLRTISGIGGNISTISGNIFVGGGAVLNATSSSTLAINGSIQNSTDNGTGANRDVSKTGIGTVTLAGNNTFTGSTTINSSGGTLNAAANGALGSGTTGTSGITVNTGGTLLLTNSAATDRIKNTAPITLAGGTIARSGFGIVSEGAGASRNGGTFAGTSVVGLGALTLTATSTLDFNLLSTGGVGTFTFASFAPVGNTLNIVNYFSSADAATNLSGVDGIDDRLIFNADQASNLAFFSFGGVAATEIALGGGFFEIVPVPEPNTWMAGGLAFAAIALGQRQRLRSLFRRS